MARPKKDKKIEVPEESLEAVLNPGYTLETVQELTVIGPSEIPEVDVRFGLIQFVRILEGFDDCVYMMARIDSLGTRKTVSKYRTEDLQDAYALGCKVDTILNVKNRTDKYSLELDAQEIKADDIMRKRDFEKFHSELEAEGYRCRMNFTVENVMSSFHTNTPFAATFEVIK